MKIILAADPFALDLKQTIVEHLHTIGYEVLDYGATSENEIPYYKSAVAAAKALQRGEATRAILICGTGMGMSLIANRFSGVRASVVESVFAAKMCRVINDANVLCLGAMIWGGWMANEAVDVFLKTELAEGLDALAPFLKEAKKIVDSIEGN